MEKLNKYIAITITIIVMAFSIWFLFNEKKEFSDTEFRYLEKWPKFSGDALFNGKYIESIENFITDHFPLRNELVELKTSVYHLAGQTLINNVYIADNNFLINKFDKPKNSDKIINIINKFKENNKDVNIEMILSPTATSIYNNLLPQNSINYNEKELIDYYYKNLNIKNIDIYNDLLMKKEEFQLFYRTDHHWTIYGAYFAYKKYCEENSIIPYNLDDFEKTIVSNDFSGTLYSKTFYGKNNKDTIYAFNLKDSNFTVKYLNKTTNSLYNNEHLNTKDKYSYFLDGNHPIVEIINNNLNTSEELLVIKDSYANSFLTLLANNYKKIHVIDPRYYNLSITDYINEHNIKNVLLLYNVNNIDTDTGIITIR